MFHPQAQRPSKSSSAAKALSASGRLVRGTGDIPCENCGRMFSSHSNKERHKREHCHKFLPLGGRNQHQPSQDRWQDRWQEQVWFHKKTKMFFSSHFCPGSGGTPLPFPRLSGDLCEVCPCEETSHLQPWGGQPTAVVGGPGFSWRILSISYPSFFRESK